MRKFSIAWATLGLLFIIGGSVSLASKANISILAENLTDSNLSQCINTLIMKQQWQTPAEVETIKCHNKDIVSTQGIQQFSNIKVLSLYNNNIESIDLSKFKKLETINLAANRLQQLTVSELPKLTRLYIFKNQLASLHLANLPALEQVKANDNKLESLMIKSTPRLAKFYLFNNQLEHLEITTLSKLSYLDVRQNPMPDEFYDFLDEQSGLTARHDGNADDWE